MSVSASGNDRSQRGQVENEIENIVVEDEDALEALEEDTNRLKNIITSIDRYRDEESVHDGSQQKNEDYGGIYDQLDQEFKTDLRLLKVVARDMLDIENKLQSIAGKPGSTEPEKWMEPLEEVCSAHSLTGKLEGRFRKVLESLENEEFQKAVWRIQESQGQDWTVENLKEDFMKIEKNLEKVKQEAADIRNRLERLIVKILGFDQKELEEKMKTWEQEAVKKGSKKRTPFGGA